MSRAERRRKQREEKKTDKQVNAILRQAGFPEFQLPPAPMRTNNLSMQEVANLTGTKVAVLENWRREATKEIEKACIATAQEKLDTAENFITASNIIATLSSLQGFHWARSAANWILEHYQEHLNDITEDNIKETYERLHEKWGIEMEFDVPQLNILLGFDKVDWVKEYIGMNIPKTVYDRIWNDSENIQAATMQVATAWELCKDFGFGKHDGQMMERFWKGYKEKYEQIDLAKKNGITDTCKMIKEKYGLEIRLPDYMKDTIERFGLQEGIIMKYIELARLLTNKSLEDCINWKCPYQMILEDEQDFCTDCNLECEDCWNKEVPSELPIVALFEANKGEAVHSILSALKSKIQAISEHYSKENQLEKCKEELHELLAELEHAETINSKVSLPGNTWTECADVIIMVAQIVMQHGKEEAVKSQMQYKLDRQLKRMAYEDN